MLVSVLQQDPVFHNQSHVDQLPIADQVAIALYRFGHHGNAVTTRDVALWAGIGYGTVCLVTNHVMKAFPKSMNVYFRMESSYGVTQHTLFIHGVRLHTKSKCNPVIRFEHISHKL